jgi:hypothetical protein
MGEHQDGSDLRQHTLQFSLEALSTQVPLEIIEELIAEARGMIKTR